MRTEAEAEAATVSELVDLLCDLPGFADVHTRAVILDELRPSLVAGFRPAASTRMTADLMIRHLLHRDGALLELAELLALFHGETPAITRLRLLVARLTEPVGPVSGHGAELVRILLADGHQPWLPSFLEIAGSAAERPPRSPAEAVAFLEELAAPPHQPPPVLRFAVALAARPGWSPLQRDDLWEWIHRLARRLGVTVPAAAESRPDGPSGDQGDGVRLVVSLQRYQPGSRECLLSMWLGYSAERWIVLVVDDEPQPLGRIVARFNTFFEKAQELSGGLPSRVEFMLPRSLLDLRVDRWSVSSRSNDTTGAGPPLGVLCPVVVRDLERPTDPRAHERWTHRWQEYERSLDLSAERAVWLPCGREQDPRGSMRQLTLALAVVVEPPSRHSQAPAGAVTRAVGTALDAGVPVVLWGRDEGDADGHVESGALHAATRRLISGGSPARLPERITSLRRKALDSGIPSPAEQLALVWDDPGGRPDVGGGALRCP
ncbi:effector-associated domain 2-containing protein [Streptomyces sp. ID05-47C]|uniref:VMAP-C domain-containing protein n=1 Tax=Streptomyces sp. ID05-47C TaxID=3028665 RepID=UPI0029BDDAEE|nr:hypothetical protein [Streptomyces sp. ID05-47C]MDX3569900.1 hypothetical protein [Streptomyces sp. ID05-47C]